MKKWLRSTAGLLALLTIIGCCFVSCSNPNAGPADSTAQTTTAETELPIPETTSKYDIGDELPSDLKYTGETVKIISRGRDIVHDELTIEDGGEDVISTAVKRRNKIVEDRLGIAISNTMTTDGGNFVPGETVQANAQSGIHEYDIVASAAYATMHLTGENLFANLRKLDNLDLDRPYWSKKFNDAASFGEKQFFCTGAIALSSYRFIFATFFNKNMFVDHQIADDMYDVVNQKKWTLDYQTELVSTFWSDVNSDQKSNEGDVLGFVANSNMISVDPYWSACCLPIISKDADGVYTYAFDIERTSIAVEKINKLFWLTPGSYAIPQKSGNAEQNDISRIFSDDHAAMVTLRIVEVEGDNMRSMNSIYGILPMPMLNEEQGEYYSFAHDSMTALAVTNTASSDRREMLGAFLEAMGSTGFSEVTPIYYEVALKSRYSKDTESWKMLDLITESLTIDTGILYSRSLNSIQNNLRSMIGENKNDVASTFTTVGRMIKISLNKLNSALSSVTGE